MPWPVSADDRDATYDTLHRVPVDVVLQRGSCVCLNSFRSARVVIMASRASISSTDCGGSPLGFAHVAHERRVVVDDERRDAEGLEAVELLVLTPRSRRGVGARRRRRRPWPCRRRKARGRC